MRSRNAPVRWLCVGLLVALFGGGNSPADEAALEVAVFKTPSCGCCTKWAEHLRAAGFLVQVQEVPDLQAVKRQYGVPQKLSSCHTALVGPYVVEGHVPVADIRRLLQEAPKIVGLAVPGMPIGSPGMEGGTPERYEVLAFDAEGRTRVFARH